MNMRNTLFLFILLFFPFRGLSAQEDVLKNFRARSHGKGDISLWGNGYSIEVRTLPTFVGLWTRVARDKYEINEERLAGAFGFYSNKDLKISRDSCYWLFSESKIDSLEQANSFTRTAYVRIKKAKIYGTVISKRQGVADTLFQRKVFDYIATRGVPDSLFESTGDTIPFLGEKLVIPRHRYYGGNTFENYHGHKYTGSLGRPFTLSWDSYRTMEEAETGKRNQLLKYKKYFSDQSLLLEEPDTVCFRSKEILADRLVWQDHFTVGNINFNSCYLMTAEVDGTPVLIHLRFNVDSINDSRRMELPAVISRYFFQLKHPAFVPDNVEPDILPSDTAFIPKRDRWPLWTYHDKNVRINGIAVGFGEADDRKNVTTNGFKFDVIGASCMLVVVAPFAITSATMMQMRSNSGDVNREYYPVIYKNRLNYANGLYLSVGGSMNCNHVLNGLGIAGLMTAYYRSTGLSITGINNSSLFGNGVQIAGLYAFSEYMKGVQIGGLYTHSNFAQGVQIGLVNQSSTTHGCQFGLVNLTRKLKGIQIGLWNKNGKRSLPIINW